jgi:Asp-tRNA(Asn)/Glu-tRNA(Gln) amidotransferase A subunit family amidase
VSYAPSLDTVGLSGREAGVVWEAYQLMRVAKSGDMMARGTSDRLADTLYDGGLLKRVVLLSDGEQVCEKGVWTKTVRFAEHLARKLSLQLHHCPFTLYEESLAAYYAIASVEAWSCLQRFPLLASSTGTTSTSSSTEYRIDNIDSEQGRRFGEEVSRRLEMARLLLQVKSWPFLERARHIQDRVSRFITDLTSDSLVIAPTAPAPPPASTDTTVPEYNYDVFTVPFSLAGVAVWSVPVGGWCGVQVASSCPLLVCE